uniref:Uncharacterized protein n=1 Tax=Candidatus Kentrum sp. TC TaxID=2126339 RepID=A0A450ZKF1_9GAMM|nr:MAG: hypothetical protein BECKTC1821F_GA0114240_100493 [Candidatus Kentron sp. TC]
MTPWDAVAPARRRFPEWRNDLETLALRARLLDAPGGFHPHHHLGDIMGHPAPQRIHARFDIKIVDQLAPEGLEIRTGFGTARLFAAPPLRIGFPESNEDSLAGLP